MLSLIRILLLMVLENNMCTFSCNPHFYGLSDLAGLWYLFQKLLCYRSNVRSFNVLDLFSVSLFLLQDNGVNILTISYWVKNTSKYIIYSIYPLSDISICVCVCVRVCVKWSEMKLLSCVRLFATPWTVAYQTSLSMGFSRQEYWSGLPFPSPRDLPNPGVEPGSPTL